MNSSPQIILQGIKLKRKGFMLDVNCQFNNKITALIGENGCGKTSLLRLIAGLEKPETGKISQSEQVFCDIKKRAFIKAKYRNIGMVFQTPRLLPHLNVLKNISLSFSQKISIEQMGMIENLGITHLLDKPVGGLSGGEAQRVALARAMIRNCSILLLDEPLSAIDVSGKEGLLDYFTKVLPLLNIPVIYVTHSLEEAGRVASDFMLMHNGKIILHGDAPTVLSQYGKARHDGIVSKLSGNVMKLGSDKIATMSIGKQQAQVMGMGLKIGAKCSLNLWARDIILASQIVKNISARNALSGKIVNIKNLANGQVEVVLDIEGQQVSAIIMARTIKEMELVIGQEIFVLFKTLAVQPY
ncbi:MAG: ATP-binding cassette domain-containing protein [Devosiaceae bacterium]|nr:ATP-binding cassette domain-containing protein [Devosiaceae bacterium]